MAFKDSWQQQRQVRLQQVAQRRQAVSALLQTTHEQRQLKASQLRSDLSLFRETLAYDASLRRQNSHQFCETLQAQTQDFLAIAQAERSLISQQLRHDLDAFRSTLKQTVESLRQEIQADLQILQIEVQAQLDDARQQRIKHQVQQSQNLKIFVEQLHATVEAFLADSALERQEKAAQAQLDRKTELEALFKKFAEFRAQLQQYRAELSHSVWGDSSQPVSQPAQPSTPKPVAVVEPPVVKAAVKPIVVMKKPEKRGRGFQVATSASASPKPPIAVEVAPLSSTEQRIHDYIEDMQGARLTEIESALGITRLQAVEGLRSLIQQGKITQKDRVYLINQ
jgi:hypothetical protein